MRFFFFQGIRIFGHLTTVRPSKSSLKAVQSLTICGILFGFIQENDTLVGHAAFGIPESDMFHTGTTHHMEHYCVRPRITASPL
jgi:hypothetical protein